MFNKLATIAALAFAQSVSADDHSGDEVVPDVVINTGYREGRCKVLTAEGKKMGDIRFNQDYDNLSEVVEAVKLDAKVKDLMGSATAIRVFSDDPMTMPE